jgi:hypothetical protein
VEILLLWLGLALVVGIAASHRGRNGFGWFLLACVISPLVAGLLVLVLPNAEIERQKQEVLKNSRKCPFCAELVRREAIVCKHCGRDLPPESVRGRPSASSSKGTPRRDFVDARKEIDEASLAILRKARDHGYQITVANEAMVAAQMNGDRPIYFTSNWDIQDWAKGKGWIDDLS